MPSTGLGLARGLRRRARAVVQTRAMLAHPEAAAGYYPELPRKSRTRILTDLYIFALRYGEPDLLYLPTGHDTADPAQAARYLPNPKFRRLRQQLNQEAGWPTGFDAEIVSEDKAIADWILTALSLPHPPTAGYVANGSYYDQAGAAQPMAELTDLLPDEWDGVCKPLGGMCGRGIYALQRRGDTLLFDGEPLAPVALADRLRGPHLLQDRVPQHEAYGALHPTSVNTLRLVTERSTGEARLLSAALRVGCGGKLVDNWAAGGLIIRVDPAAGTLDRYGFRKPGHGGRSETHPDTGIRFEGYELPFALEAIELVLGGQRRLHCFGSIGWDVAVTPDGPLVLEFNRDWDGGIPMVLEPDFAVLLRSLAGRRTARAVHRRGSGPSGRLDR